MAATWTRQFGTEGDDVASNVSVDGSGNIYVAGQAGGALPDQTFQGDGDAFVRAYDADGNTDETQRPVTTATPRP